MEQDTKKLVFHMPGIALPDRSRPFLFIIELAVVVGIIGIVMGIIFPVYRSAEGTARGAVCLDNLRKLGQMVAMYAQDYDGLYPPLPPGKTIEEATGPTVEPALAWTTRLGPYREAKERQNPFFCPAAKVPTYAYNAGLGAHVFPKYDPNAGPVSEAGVVRPSETFLMFDTANQSAAANALTGYRFFYGAPRQAPFRPGDFVLPTGAIDQRWMRPRHADGASALYCDGHVRRISDPAIRKQSRNPFDPAASEKPG